MKMLTNSILLALLILLQMPNRTEASEENIDRPNTVKTIPMTVQRAQNCYCA